MPHEMKSNENIEWIINRIISFIENNIKEYKIYKKDLQEGGYFHDLFSMLEIVGAMHDSSLILNDIKANFSRIISNELMYKITEISDKTIKQGIMDSYLIEKINDLKNCKV